MRRLAHLIALNALALLQPTLDQLARNPEYLILENYSLPQVAAVAFLLAVPLPTLQFLLCRWLERHTTPRAANRLLITFVAVWGTLCGLVAVRWLSAAFRLPDLGIPQLALALLAPPAGLLVAWLYKKSELFRQTLALSAAGALIFPLSLLAVPAIRFQLLGQPLAPKAPPGHVNKPVPVIMLVFDGLNGMSLLNSDHQVNRTWFPGFARLAEISTHYRNATTVHTRTDHALPALLTSCIPEEHQQPVEADYPAGLFRLISDSRQFDVSIFEPLTRLSPPELRQLVHHRSDTAQTLQLLNTLLRVFVQISLPQELQLQPAIPREWFGMIPIQENAWRPMKGQIIYPWDDSRTVQTEHFLASLQPTQLPGFRFLHVALPHYPWSLLPSGESYIPNGLISSAVFGLKGEIWTSDPWPAKLATLRNLMQIQYADQVVGRMLDVLDATGQLDQALVVVTADHGLCFTPGKSLRDPSHDTLADLLPVPLFIKLPGQSQSRVSDKNAETIDLLPTLAEVLQMQTDPAWQGSSLLSGTPRPRKTVRGFLNTILEPDFPARFRHSSQLLKTFPPNTPLDDPASSQALPELLGQPVTNFPLLPPPANLKSHVIPETLRRRLTPPPTLPGKPFIPCLIHGRISRQTDTEPLLIAIAVNGRIVSTTRTPNDPEIPDIWAAWVPPDQLPESESTVQLFLVHSPREQLSLSEIPVISPTLETRKWEPDWLFQDTLFE